MLHSSNRGTNGVRVREHIYNQEDGMDKSHAHAKRRTLHLVGGMGLIVILAAASEVRDGSGAIQSTGLFV